MFQNFNRKCILTKKGPKKKGPPKRIPLAAECYARGYARGFAQRKGLGRAVCNPPSYARGKGLFAIPLAAQGAFRAPPQSPLLHKGLFRDPPCYARGFLQSPLQRKGLFAVPLATLPTQGTLCNPPCYGRGFLRTPLLRKGLLDEEYPIP